MRLAIWAPIFKFQTASVRVLFPYAAAYLGQLFVFYLVPSTGSSTGTPAGGRLCCRGSPIHAFCFLCRLWDLFADDNVVLDPSLFLKHPLQPYLRELIADREVLFANCQLAANLDGS
jgi:hypothetical protein